MARSPGPQYRSLRSRPLRRAVGTMSLAAMGLAVGLGAVGCATAHPEDPVEKALLLTKLRRQADAKLGELSTDMDLNDPADWDKGIQTMKEMADLYRQGVRLEHFSYIFRKGYGGALRGIGLLNVRKHDRVQAEIDRLESLGQTPPGRLVKEKEDSWREAVRYLELANSEFTFYVTHIMKNYPDWEIYELLGDNYRMLGDLSGALAALRGGLAEFGGSIPEDIRRELVKIARDYEKRIAEDEAARDTP